MFADRVQNFISELIEITKKGLLTWEHFPQQYPFSNNIFVQSFIQSHPEMDKKHSYFFSYKAGLVLFIRCKSSKPSESVYMQKHFGDPIISLTEGYHMEDTISELGKEIDHAIESDASMPAGVYQFMSDIENLNFSSDVDIALLQKIFDYPVVLSTNTDQKVQIHQIPSSELSIVFSTQKLDNDSYRITATITHIKPDKNSSDLSIVPGQNKATKQSFRQLQKKLQKAVSRQVSFSKRYHKKLSMAMLDSEKKTDHPMKA